MRTQLKPSLNRPRDFRAFWDKTLAELAAVPTALERRPVEGSPSSGLTLERIAFDSLGGVRIVRASAKLGQFFLDRSRHGGSSS